MLLCGLVSRIMYKAMWLASGIPEALPMVGWQLSRIRCETMWLARGIPKAFTMWAGLQSKCQALSMRLVRGSVSYLCWHKLWNEAMTMVGDFDEAFS